MWIVNLALRRPYTFIVLAIFILIAGVLAIIGTPKDIFPSINIPVISVIWNYAGLSPQDMEEKITWPYERVSPPPSITSNISSRSRFMGSAWLRSFCSPPPVFRLALLRSRPSHKPY